MSKLVCKVLTPTRLFYTAVFNLLNYRNRYVWSKICPDEIDSRISEMIVLLRKRQGITQRDIARHLGITFQQVHKYESAQSRLSASALYKIAQLLQVPVDALFGEYNIPAPTDTEIVQILKYIIPLTDDDRHIVKNLAKRLMANA